MVLRPVLLWPDPRLREICAPVDPGAAETAALIDDLFETMYAANGRGLAAPQIGVLSRVFVVDVTWKEGDRSPRAFINPVLTYESGEDSGTLEEQCLSIPEIPMPVTRRAGVIVTHQTPDGKTATEVFDGIMARCIQHEADHLDGKVIFDHQSPTARQGFEAQYAG